MDIYTHTISYDTMSGKRKSPREIASLIPDIMQARMYIEHLIKENNRQRVIISTLGTEVSKLKKELSNWTGEVCESNHE